MSGLGSVDGEIRPVDEIGVPLDDRGFLLGDAVYETMRTYQGRLFALDDHMVRLRRSLEAVRMRDAPAADTLVGWAEALVRAAYTPDGGEELVVRVMVTRGRGPHGMSTRGAGPPRTYLLARALPAVPEAVYEEGLAVITAHTLRVPPAAQHPMIKAASALNLVLARVEADEAGADEALLRDVSGRYLEATSANLIVVAGDRMHTARGADGVLEGVTMRRVVRLAEAAGLRPVWGPVAPQVLAGAEEVLLTQTTREVLPVVRVDGAPVGDGVPGAWARRLRRAYRGEVERWLVG